jgi:hypothetical protein
MGLEHFYQLIDREAVDPFLALSWREFHRQCRWKDFSQWGCAAEFLTEFALDGEFQDPKMVQRILASRTLRWTMLRSSPQYFFLYEMVLHAPAVSSRCPTVWPPVLEEIAMMMAAAVDGFLGGRIGKRTLGAVFTLHGSLGEIGWLELPHAKLNAVVEALTPYPQPQPIFPWQDDSCIGNGYRSLGLRDTHAFLNFLRRAWAEGWPCTYLGAKARGELPAPKKRALSIRDCSAARRLLAYADSGRIGRPCVIRYFG